MHYNNVMETIYISNIDRNIVNDVAGNKVYDKIKNSLKKSCVKLDFSNVNVITVYCASQIFRTLLNEIGENAFEKNIIFTNVPPCIEVIINLALNS